MGILFISIALWSVVLYSLRVALFGNPLYLCIVQAHPDLLVRADQVARQAREPADAGETAFLQQFSRLTLLGAVVFMLETALLVYLLATHQLVWLSSLLLLKNVLLVAISLSYANQADHDGLFRSLLNVPRWVVLLDRISALASGLGLLVAFLHVNGIQFWK